MTSAVSLIRHRKTMSGWTGDGKVWVWYEGPEDALKGLKQDALTRFGSRIEVGPPNYISASPSLSYMAFVFSYKNDAMMFKLSVG